MEAAKEIKVERGAQHTKVTREELKKKLLKQKEEDSQKVKGVFRYFEMPGGTLAFSYRCYKDEEVERYEMVDGQVYEIPLGVAKHLNKNGWYPQYEYIKGESFQGGYGISGGMRMARKVHRYGFSGLDFIDLDEPQKIVQVTAI